MNQLRKPKHNHEYTPYQLMRFHMLNLVNRLDQLHLMADKRKGREHLTFPARQTLQNLPRDTTGVPLTFVDSDEYYRNCANALTKARSISDQEPPSQARTEILQALNSAVYSTIAIIKLMALHPTKPDANAPTNRNQPPTT